MKLNKNRILGVDLGIVNTATMSVYDSNTGEYIKIPWKERIIDGTELIHIRQKIYARRRALSIQSKWAGESRIGHGRKKRMQPVDKIGDKYARFRDTYNHKISRYIVNLAIKYGCGTIQMEDLSGFTESQQERLLKEWAYYDLQEKTRYKAEEVGIEFKLKNPKYTSKRCNKCGCIDDRNRDCKNNQAKFVCVNCGHEDNADINASNNLALPNIEELIEEYLKNHKTIQDKTQTEIAC